MKDGTINVVGEAAFSADEKYQRECDVFYTIVDLIVLDSAKRFFDGMRELKIPRNIFELDHIYK